MTESMQIEPFEAAEIGPFRLRTMPIEQLHHPLCSACLPGTLGQIDVGGIERLLELLIHRADRITLGIGLLFFSLGRSSASERSLLANHSMPPLHDNSCKARQGH